MSNLDDSERRSGTPQSDDGVLAKLPRTRPQRSSRRRTEARKARVATSAVGTPAVGTSAVGRGPARSGTRSKRAGTATKGGTRRPPSETAAAVTAERPRESRPKESVAKDSPRSEERVPRQGFESEGEVATGPVQPPGGAELVASAAEVVVELAKAGLSSGERLLKDLVNRMPRP